MALPATIYRATVEISDIDRGIYESIQTTLAQHPSETKERVVARLLAMAIFYEADIAFTKGISATDEPDIWVIGADGRVRLWIEVGIPDADRIIKASRHAERVALLAYGKAFASWDQQQLPKLANIGNLTVVCINNEFIAKLAAELERVIPWSITITEGTLYLTGKNMTCETAILPK